MKTRPISLKVVHIKNMISHPELPKPNQMPPEINMSVVWINVVKMKLLGKWVMQSCLTVLEVVEEDGPLLGLFTPVLDDNARAVYDLASVTLAVKSTETSPLSQLLSVGNLDQWNLVLGAKSLDELLVGLFLAGLIQHTHVGLTPVEGLGGLTNTTGKSVVDKGVL